MRLRSQPSILYLSVKTSAILLGTLALYWQDLSIVATEALQSELASHILAIPLLLGYLLYRKRKMVKAVISFGTSTLRRTLLSHEAIGAILCLLAFLAYWHGSYTFHPLEYHLVSLPLFAAGLILTLFNTGTLRVLAFPLAFLLFLVPPPLEIVYALGTSLSIVSSEASYTLLKAMGLPVNLTAQYGNPVIVLAKPGSNPLAFAVDIACAGLYSLIGFTIFAVFVAYIARGKTWKKATIFLAGFPLIYALNITRILIIVLIGAQYGMEVAMHVFHLLGGWVFIFTGTLILLTLSERVFKIQLFATGQKMVSCNYCNSNPESKQHFCGACGRILNPMSIRLSKWDLGKITLLAIGAILILSIQVPVFALTEGPAQVTIQTLGGQQTATQILPETHGYRIEFVFRDRRFEEIAKQDASLAYAYRPTSTDTSKMTVWVGLELAKTRSSLHRWEVCLITWALARGYQPRATQLSLREVQLLQNPPITARYFAFQEMKSTVAEVVLYWYENAYFNTTSNIEQENVKISLIAFARNTEDVLKIEEMLLPFGKAIANYWQPIKTWSQIALTIAQHGGTLMAVTTTPLVIALSYLIVGDQRAKRSNLRVYNRLALEEEKMILQAVHQASKEDKPTGKTIASYYQKLAGKPIELNLLLQKLREAEEAGLIKRDIASREDEPNLVWKSRTPVFT